MLSRLTYHLRTGEYEIFGIAIIISLKFVPQDANNNMPAFDSDGGLRRPGDKPFSEPMVVSLRKHIQYIPRNMHTVFALLCFVVVIHWLILPCPSGLLHWHCGNLTIAPVPAKQPWWIWINTSCEFIMNDCITATKQSTQNRVHISWDIPYASLDLNKLTFTHQFTWLAQLLICTVYPKKYAHGFVVVCFVVVMLSFIMISHEVFIHIHQGCFAGTVAIVRLPQCQWSKPDGYGKISQCITTTKHSKAKTVCIFLGIYCMAVSLPGKCSWRIWITQGTWPLPNKTTNYCVQS